MIVTRKLAPLVVALVCALAVSVAFASAQENKPAQTPPIDEKTATEMMQKLATPGEGHKKLDVLVGSWNAKSSMWGDPSKPPEVSEGTSEHKWVLGGRYVEQRFEGTFMGMPFSGIGYTGYDNYKKRYVGVWMDSAGTAMFHTTGSFDASGKVLTSAGRMDDFTSGKVITIREKMTIVNKDEVLFEMWVPDPTGKDYLMMKIDYTRKQ
jgi:hypothetical protein